MEIILGTNRIINCKAALVVNGDEVFRLRERDSDGRLVCDFVVRDKEGNTLAKIAKNNVVHSAKGYKVTHESNGSSVIDSDGKVIAKVEEIGYEVINIIGEFSFMGFTVTIDEKALKTPNMTMSGNIVSGFGKAVELGPNSSTIGAM